MHCLRPFKGVAWISQSTLGSMINEARRVSAAETGGIFAGYWVTNFGELVITDAVGPGPLAIHKVNAFVPDSDYHCSEIARIYRDSGRLYTYLGDWHTHPDDNYRLSRKDSRTLRKIARSPSARARAPIMGVLVKVPTWRLHLWCCLPGGLRSFWHPRMVRFHLRIFS